MKKTLSFIVLAILVIGVWQLTAQRRTQITPSKNYVTKTITNVSNFDKIVATNTADIKYSIANGAAEVKVYCPDNIFEILDIRTDGNTLNITTKKGYDIRGSHNIVVTCSSETLSGVTLTGTGDFESGSKLTSPTFTIKTTGTGDFKARYIDCQTLDAKSTGTGDIEVDNIEVGSVVFHSSGTGDIDIKRLKASTVQATSTGTGDIELSGEADNVTFKSTGTGDIEAKNLRAREANVSTSGTGDIECHAYEKIDGRRSGTGKIYYYGDPKTTNFSKKGIVKR